MTCIRPLARFCLGGTKAPAGPRKLVRAWIHDYARVGSTITRAVARGNRVKRSRSQEVKSRRGERDSRDTKVDVPPME
jgi:hypothetical protein